MLSLCVQEKLRHWVSVTEKAVAEEDRQVRISVFQKENEALREMNFAGDSISGA